MLQRNELNTLRFNIITKREFLPNGDDNNMTLDMPSDKLPEVIRISEKNAKRIYSEGHFGENYNDVLTRMLDELEELRKKKR